MSKDTKELQPYEDWTPPAFLQGDIDPDEARREFYVRQRENYALRSKNRSLLSKIDGLNDRLAGGDGDGEGDEGSESETPQKQDSDESTAPSQSTKKGAGQGPSLNEIRLELALEKGLSKSQAMRLRGETREELEKDADLYMQEHGMTSGNEDEDEGGDENDDDSGSEDGADDQGRPPSQQPRVRSGSEREGRGGRSRTYNPDDMAKFFT